MSKRAGSKKKSYYHPSLWPLHVGFFLLHGIALLPRFIKKALCTLVGWLLFTLPTPMRLVAAKNIAVCFPELDAPAQKRILKENLQLLALTLIEGLNMAWPSKTNIFPSLGKIEGLEHIDKALAEGRGVLLLFPHLTEIYLVALLLIQKLPYNFSLMYNSPKNPVLKRFFDVNMKKYCKNAFTRKETRAMIQQLKAGQVVWYAPDLAPNKAGHRVFAPFFNIPAATYTTTARIAGLSGAACIAIAFYRRENEAVYDIIFHQALENFPSHDELADATLLNQTVENIVKKAPTQYLWIYKRFARRPDGKKDFYQENP